MNAQINLPFGILSNMQQGAWKQLIANARVNALVVTSSDRHMQLCCE
jgi:hypothetical protein